jgi:hypothetical protein
VLQTIEAPHHVAVPVHLHQIHLILRAMARIALARAAEDVAIGQQLVRKTLQPLPQLLFAPIHVDEQRTVARCLEERVAAPGLVRFV